MKYILIIILSICLVYTASGNIPQGIQYWELPTGSRIAYFHFDGKEPAKDTPIIYLHGGPGGFVTSSDTAVFSQLANDGYDVYLYDQIGGGKSARLKNIRQYTVKRHLRDLEAIVEKIGAQKVIFIGHSWGGSLAPLYLARHPDRVEKMIFSGPGGMIPKRFKRNTPLPDSIKLNRIGNAKYAFSDYMDPVRINRYNKIASYARLGIKTASDYEIDSLLDLLMNNRAKKKALLSGITKTVDLEYGSGGYCHIRTSKYIEKGRNPRKILKKSKIPVLILLGETDEIQWACIADYLTVFLNRRLVIIKGSGHSVFTNQPENCLKITRAFLGEPEI
jgi:proline iminopeptidase